MAQLLPELEAALFMLEMAPGAESHLQLHGSVGRRAHVMTRGLLLLSLASQLRAGSRAVQWNHVDESSFSWVKENSNVLTVFTGSDCG